MRKLRGTNTGGRAAAAESPSAPSKSSKSKAIAVADSDGGSDTEFASSDDEDEAEFEGQAVAIQNSRLEVLAAAKNFVALAEVAEHPMTAKFWAAVWRKSADFLQCYNSQHSLDHIDALIASDVPTQTQFDYAFSMALGMIDGAVVGAAGPTASPARTGTPQSASAAARGVSPRQSLGNVHDGHSMETAFVVPRPSKQLLCLAIGGMEANKVTYPGSAIAHIDNVLAVQHAMAADGAPFNHPPAMETWLGRIRPSLYSSPVAVKAIKDMFISGNLSNILNFAKRPHPVTRDTVVEAVRNLCTELATLYSDTCLLLQPLTDQWKFNIDRQYNRVLGEALAAGAKDTLAPQIAAKHVLDKIEYALKAWQGEARDQLEDHFRNARAAVDPHTGDITKTCGFMPAFRPPNFNSLLGEYGGWSAYSLISASADGQARQRTTNTVGSQRGRQPGTTKDPGQRARAPASSPQGDTHTAALVLTPGQPLPKTVQDLMGTSFRVAMLSDAGRRMGIGNVQFGDKPACGKFLLNGHEAPLGCNLESCRRVHVNVDGNQVARSAPRP